MYGCMVIVKTEYLSRMGFWGSEIMRSAAVAADAVCLQLLCYVEADSGACLMIDGRGLMGLGYKAK